MKLFNDNTCVSNKSLKELLGQEFYIPAYQRGYKWKELQIEELLNDLYDSYRTGTSNPVCLQPLAVRLNYDYSDAKSKESIKNSIDENQEAENLLDLINDKIKTKWEVIDGQQRLTTLFLILKNLNVKSLYSIDYHTRKDSWKFLQNINEDSCRENPDFYHIYKVNEAIEKWIDKTLKKTDDIKSFSEFIIENVFFIWYKTFEDPVKVFTRLNIGKISLTNAELIKALFLNRDDKNSNTDKDEIAKEWDSMEVTLQNDELWYFLNRNDAKYNTRMDLVFNIIKDDKISKYIENHKSDPGIEQKKQEIKSLTGTDKYSTFRFIDYLTRGKILNEGESVPNPTYSSLWNEVKSVYNALLEWFNDLEIYHYVGYCISEMNITIVDIYKEWKKSSKEKFRSFLTKKIKEDIEGLKINTKKKDNKDNILESILDIQYRYDGVGESCPVKTKCRKLLLLHNILYVINQNTAYNDKSQYQLPVFYKFPFHLYKKEKWDVEHIDSNTTNKLTDNYNKLCYLLQFQNNEKISVDKTYKELLDESKEFCGKLQSKDSDILIEKNMLNNLFKDQAEADRKIQDVINMLEQNSDHSNKQMSQAEKNQIWNFTLLDSSTNRSYGNSLFADKRRTIMAKDQGMVQNLYFNKKDKTFIRKIESKADNESVIAFIPPVTRNVFMKYYSPADQTTFEYWKKKDAEAYRQNMEELFKSFIFLDN